MHFMYMEHQTNKPEQIQELLQIMPRNCLNKL